MTNLKANTSAIALGIDLNREGLAMAQSGIATLAQGIADNWFYSMRWSYGSGDNEMADVCNLGDMFKGRMNGTAQDGKFLPAMYRAVAENFGVEDGFSNADKVAFNRAFTIAAARHAGVPVEIVDANVRRKGKTVKVKAVQVPAGVAFDLEKDDGSPTELGNGLLERVRSLLALEGKTVDDDAELMKRAKALPVSCVGGNHAAFGKVPSAAEIANTLSPTAVGAGLMLPKGNRTRANSDKFVGSLDFVLKCLREVLVDGDEAGFAPSDSINDKLRELHDVTGLYLSDSQVS